MHVLSTFVQLKSVLLISCVFWISSSSQNAGSQLCVRFLEIFYFIESVVFEYFTVWAGIFLNLSWQACLKFFDQSNETQISGSLVPPVLLFSPPRVVTASQLHLDYIVSAWHRQLCLIHLSFVWFIWALFDSSERLPVDGGSHMCR